MLFFLSWDVFVVTASVRNVRIWLTGKNVQINQSLNTQLISTKPNENEPDLSQNMAYGYLRPQNATDI